MVSTRTGAIPELVTPNEGILVPQANPEALADAIRTVLNSSSLREQFGQSGVEGELPHPPLSLTLIRIRRRLSVPPYFFDFYFFLSGTNSWPSGALAASLGA